MANMKAIGQLTAKTTPASTDVFALEDTEDTKKINYDALADAILNKITSKNYTVAGSSQTLINAINTLNSNLSSKIYRDSNSKTTYTIPVPNKIPSAFWHLVFFGGTAASKPFVYHAFIGTQSTHAVTLTPIIGIEGTTLTATWDSSSKTVSLESNVILYGGINVIVP